MEIAYYCEQFMVDAFLSDDDAYLSQSSLPVIKDYCEWRNDIFVKKQERLKDIRRKRMEKRKGKGNVPEEEVEEELQKYLLFPSTLGMQHSFKTMWYVKKLADALPGKWPGPSPGGTLGMFPASE